MATNSDDQSRQSPSDSQFNGRLLVVVASVMWSTNGLFAKAPALDAWDQEIRGPLLAFWRAVFACVVLLPMVRRPRWSWKLVPMVLFFVAMNVTFLTAMSYAEAAAVVWLQYTAPLWVFIFSALWLREKVTWRDCLMLVFGAMGVGLILTYELSGAGEWGVICGLLSGVTFAGVVLSLRQLREHESAWLVGLNHLITSLVLLPYVVCQDVWPEGEQWFYLSGYGILQMGLPYLLFALGIQKISGHEASCIVLLEPLLVPLWVFVAWRHDATYQAPQWWTLVGGGLILAGLISRYAGEFSRTKASDDAL